MVATPETVSVRRAALLYNPKAGRGSSDRLRVLKSIAQALRQNAVDTEIIATEAPGAAGRQAAEACERGIDILFACGGDGTVHEVLQGMVFHPSCALGIVPLGSANVLARHLSIPLHPVEAALHQLNCHPQIVPIGKVFYQTPAGEESRYFLVMAGAGADGALVYKMLSGGKHRLGRWMYYLRSAGLFLSTPFPTFAVTVGAATDQAVSAMAVRVGDLGGLFSPLIRGASIHDPQLLLTTVSAPATLSLPSWFALGWMRMQRWNRYVQTTRVDGFTCGPGKTHPVQVQADGEWLGHTPMRVELVPSALRLLVPNS
jgi:YegS/Rv2252/BmrU family lipid kinase